MPLHARRSAANARRRVRKRYVTQRRGGRAGEGGGAGGFHLPALGGGGGQALEARLADDKAALRARPWGRGGASARPACGDGLRAQPHMARRTSPARTAGRSSGPFSRGYRSRCVATAVDAWLRQ